MRSKLSQAAALILGGVLLCPAALAESSTVLPASSQVLYAGLGANHFNELQLRDDAAGSAEVDPALRSRLDVYAAHGLSDRLQLSLYTNLQHGRVLDSDARGPCPGGVGEATEEDYCTPYTTVGGSALQARYALMQGVIDVVPSLALGGDPWNGTFRGRFVSPGPGVAEVAPGLVLGKRLQLGELGLGLLAAGTYALRLGRVVDGSAGSFTAPGDEVGWTGEVHLRPAGPVSVELGLHGVQRLWGVDWDAAYQSSYFQDVDRWNALWYRHLAGSAKLSLALSESMGLHVGASRVIAVRNGPPDTWDFTAGVHRYFAARASGAGS